MLYIDKEINFTTITNSCQICDNYITDTTTTVLFFFCLDSSSAFSFTEDKHAFVLY